MSSIRVVVYDTPVPPLKASSAYYLRGVGPPSGPAIAGAEPHFVGRFKPAQLRVNRALWQYPALDRNALKAEVGSYRFTFPPDALSIDFNRGSVGSSISGGTFSRGRWRKLIEEEEERAAAERQAEQKAREAQREAQDKAREAKEAAKREARRREDEANAARRAEAAIAAAATALTGSQQLSATLQHAQLMAAAARAAHGEAQAKAAAERAEEEAILALLRAEEEARAKPTNAPLAKAVAPLMRTLMKE
jgi:hypothetical protein